MKWTARSPLQFKQNDDLLNDEDAIATDPKSIPSPVQHPSVKADNCTQLDFHSTPEGKTISPKKKKVCDENESPSKRQAMISPLA